MSMNMRIGFIGVGGIAQDHIRVLKQIENTEIVSVFDLNKEQAQKAAEATGAEVMESANQVLDKQRIDLVFICTPQFARGDLEVTAARRGIPFFVEKPVGIDMEVVRKKEQIIRETGIVHAVGYVLRYMDTVQTAKRYLQGRPAHLIQGFRLGTSHPSKWWRQLDMSGGHLVDTVTHQVDMIRYLAGEFREVRAQFGRVSFDQTDPESTIYDAGAISFSMNSGTIGSLTESCVSPFYSGSDIKFFGHDFFVHLSGNGSNLTIIDNEQHIVETNKLDPGYEQCRTLIEAIRSGSQASILCSYTDALRTLEVTLAANQSAI
ncbi:Gfo/Idh/MocA family protein [Paenibacillus eucommiae]|uniref:Dehydrogenase n=1 Tax=Paenibacillus eucommiae TaxID=1355755 RepID=A0ABS4ISZ8_9BACL|nr:Gfo/Idh/MocA family oxidoreductase [Paenibacillus eucommiae]MBP1990694.1 putative dehydrogenase [Paenibacillus eucommiae]